MKQNTHVRNVFLVVEVRDHSYFFCCWWFLCKIWSLTPCNKIIDFKFLTDDSRGNASSPSDLYYSKKSNALTFASNSVRILLISEFLIWIFKNLKFDVGILNIILTKTTMSQQVLSVFHAHLMCIVCLLSLGILS